MLFASHVVKPPEPRPEGPVKMSVGGYHTDGGRPVPEMQWDHSRNLHGAAARETSSPMLSLKVAYFLTDTRERHCGAMRCVPGSHRSDVPPGPGAKNWREHASDEELAEANALSEPEGAIELAVPAGSAVLFDRRLW